MKKLASYAVSLILTLSLSLIPTASSASPSFQIVGQATLKVLFWKIYTATLKTDTGNYSDQTKSFELELIYHRSIERSDLISETEKQWQRLGVESQQYGPWLSQLEGIWPDIKKGDNLTLTVINSTSSFSYNGEVIGQIEDTQFGTTFSAIWLSESAEYPRLRNQLIGANKDEKK